MVPWLLCHLTKCLIAHLVPSTFSWPNFSQPSLISIGPWTLLTPKAEQTLKTLKTWACFLISYPENWLMEPDGFLSHPGSFPLVFPASLYFCLFLPIKENILFFSVWFWDTSWIWKIPRVAIYIYFSNWILFI